MKKQSHRSLRKTPDATGLGVALLFLAAGALIAEVETNPAADPAPDSAAVSTNATRVEIPQSEFAIPTTPTDGRDPFFPLSRRIMFNSANDTNKSVKTAAVALTLQGISGTESKRYALISGTTFVAGEERNVAAGNGRVRVQCIEIRESSVTIEVDGNRQELKLRPGL